jgi:hypothetical protein
VGWLQARTVERTGSDALPYVLSCTLEQLYAACVVDTRCPADMDRTILETELYRLGTHGTIECDGQRISPRKLLRPTSLAEEFDGNTHPYTYRSLTLLIECCCLPTTLHRTNNAPAEGGLHSVLESSDRHLALFRLVRILRCRSAVSPAPAKDLKGGCLQGIQGIRPAGKYDARHWRRNTPSSAHGKLHSGTRSWSCAS